MDEARTFARRYLEFIVAEARPGGEDGLAAHATAVIDALVELRVFAPPEAADWRARIERTRDDASSVDAAMQAKAIAYVEGRLARARSGRGFDFTRVQRFSGALMAVQALGAVPGEGFAELALRATPISGLPPAPPVPAPTAPPPFEAWDLLHVVPGPPERRSGLRIASLDRYRDCAVVTWHLVVPVGERDPIWPDEGPQLALSDDAETAYERAGEGWNSGEAHDGPRVLIGQTIFVPAVPVSATWVEVRRGGDTIRVAAA